MSFIFKITPTNSTYSVTSRDIVVSPCFNLEFSFLTASLIAQAIYFSFKMD